MLDDSNFVFELITPMFLVVYDILIVKHYEIFGRA